MAIVKLNAPFEKVAGQVGGPSGPVLFFSRGRQFSRAFFNPANPDTTNQQLVRAYFSAAAQAWPSVTDAEAAAWQALIDGGATDNDVFGDAKRLDPMNLYSRVNCLRQINGQAILDTAPSPAGANGLSSMTSATYDDATGQLVITHPAISGSGDRILFFRLSPVLPGLQRKARANEVRFRTAALPGSVKTLTAGSETSTTITLPTGTYPDSGDFRIGILVTSTSTGYIPGGRLFVRSLTITNIT